MAEPFQIKETKSTRNAAVLSVYGNLDAKSTPLLVAHCQKYRGADKNVVLNLSQVEFIASSGVGGLLALMEDFTSSGLTIQLAELSTAVSSVIKLLNLDRFMTIVSREDDAVAAAEH